MDSEDEDGSIKSHMMGQYEASRHRQLIIMGQGDIDKDMCMIKPFKTLT